jgi:hypothetical protein
MRRGKRLEISGECDQWERWTWRATGTAGSAVADEKMKKDGDKWRV